MTVANYALAVVARSKAIYRNMSDTCGCLYIYLLGLASTSASRISKPLL